MKKLLWIVVYVGGIALVNYILRESISLNTPSDKINLLNTVILGATGIVLIWYTVETQHLRKESQRQTEIQQRPFVVFEVQSQAGEDIPSRFLVRNIGAGTAINVRVGTVPLLKTGDAFIQFPDVVTVLPVGTSQSIHAESFLQGQRMPLDASLDPRYTSPMRTGPLMVTVEFQNVEMMPYFVTEKVAPHLLEIIDTGKVSRSLEGHIG